jgi:hypothetical protein
MCVNDRSDPSELSHRAKKLRRDKKVWSFRIQNFVVSLLASVCCLSVLAQNFDIDWYTIDGGSGSSTGGTFEVSGTIGQPDAGSPLSGGSYVLQGGFWSLFAVQTPDAPLIGIVRDGPGHAMISWEPDMPDFVLQQSDSLSSANWTDSPSGSTNPVTVPVTGQATFYRLIQP